MNKIFSVLLFCITINTTAQIYYAESDTLYNGIYYWTLDNDFTKIQHEEDTSMTGIQIYNPAIKFYGPSNTVHMGNTGLASRSNIFNERNYESDFEFAHLFRPYIITPKDLQFYNAKKPFTQLFFTESIMPSIDENLFDIFHTQNVNKNLNFGVNAKIIASEGQYINQKTEHYTFAPYISYVKNRTSIHAAFFRSRLKLHENGGVMMDSLQLSTTSLPVYLENTKSKIQNKRFYFVATHGIGSKQNNLTDTTGNSLDDIYFSDVSYEFDYDENSRTFIEDELPININDTTPYYKNTYIKSGRAYDSTYFRKIKNTIQYRFNEKPSSKYKFSGRVAFTHETNMYRYNTPDTLFKITEINTTVDDRDTSYYKKSSDVYRGTGFTNTYLLVSLYNRTSKSWNWEFTGQQYVTGDYAGDMQLNGNISKIFRYGKDSLRVVLKGGLKTQSPNYFWQKYESAHFKWDTDFDRTSSTMFGAIIDVPGLGVKLDGSFKMISKYKYFGLDSLPQQHDAELGLLTLKFLYKFRLGNFHFKNNIVYQKTIGDDIIRVPEITLYSSWYYDKIVFDKAARFQGGFDFMFNTKYFADSYMSATNKFHIQNDVEVGGYPYLDLFLNLKIRQATLFLKAENLLSWQFGDNSLVNRNYYFAPRYPDNEMRMRLGVKWTLFN